MPPSAHLLFYLALAWCLYWLYAADRRPRIVILAIIIGGAHVLLAARGSYSDSTAMPPPQALLLAPPLLALGFLLAWPKGRAWMRGLPLFALTAIHALRLPVELVLHEAHAAGLVPQDMTYSGFNLDILSGISALGMMAWMRSRHPPPRTALIAWNLCCLALLLIVVATASLSVPSVVQRINFDQPNVLVTSVPWVLLPAMLVPSVLFAHVAALVQLLQER
jgi:hypothetical protein